MSRAAAIGACATLIVAAVALAVAGFAVVAFALAALGAIGLTSWFFYEIGRSEDRDMERERRTREGRTRELRRRLRLPPRR